jgi:hypothetical protein
MEWVGVAAGTRRGRVCEMMWSWPPSYTGSAFGFGKPLRNRPFEAEQIRIGHNDFKPLQLKDPSQVIVPSELVMPNPS